MTKPFFSVIIPALNEEKYLPLLLSDLTKQSFRDFEVIVVDGESDDQTVKKARTFKSKLPTLHVLSSKRRHVCTQRNLGAGKAKSDWLVFMDADNRLPPYFLQGIKYRLESDPTDIATCYLKSDQNTTKDKLIALALNYGHEIINRTSSPGVLEALIIVSIKAFHKIGGFDESINLSEGFAFGKIAHQNQLSIKVYEDPVYTFSFRRIRKFGILKPTSAVAQNELAKLLDIPIDQTKVTTMYPMHGGKLFETSDKKSQNFTARIRQLLSALNSPTTKQKLKQLLSD